MLLGTYQDLVGVCQAGLERQREVSQRGLDELGLRYDGRHLVQPLLPDLPVLVRDLRRQVPGDLLTV